MWTGLPNHTINCLSSIPFVFIIALRVKQMIWAPDQQELHLDSRKEIKGQFLGDKIPLYTVHLID